MPGADGRSAAASKAKRARQQGLAAATRAIDDDDNEDLIEDPQIRSIMAVVENSKFEVGIAVICMADFAVEVRPATRCSAKPAGCRQPWRPAPCRQISQFVDDQAYSKTISMIARHDPHQLFFTVAMKASLSASPGRVWRCTLRQLSVCMPPALYRIACSSASPRMSSASRGSTTGHGSTGTSCAGSVTCATTRSMRPRLKKMWKRRYAQPALARARL
jgi:hypothetical protein